MSTEQTNKTDSNKNSKSQVPEFGLSFKGLLTTIGDEKEWKDYTTGKTLGKQRVLGVTDKKVQYTYTLKVEQDQAFPMLNFMDEVTVINAGVQSDKGQHRLTGDLVH